MKRLRLSLALGAVLAAALAACGTEPTASGPGTAGLVIHGTRGECHSFGCGYIARLDGPDGRAQAGFIRALNGPELSLGSGLPAVVSEGDYQLTFELRLMSDLLTGDGSQDFDIGATCRVSFNVGPGRSVVMVRVTFGGDTCSVALNFEPMGRRDLYPR